MNSILYNLSILILGTGIIMITIYITKVNNNGYILHVQDVLRIKNENDIYNDKPSNVFKTMFLESSIIQDYQTFNANDKTEKLYK